MQLVGRSFMHAIQSWSGDDDDSVIFVLSKMSVSASKKKFYMNVDI